MGAAPALVAFLDAGEGIRAARARVLALGDR